MIALIVSKDLNSTNLEELVSYLRSHDIEFQVDKHQRKIKYVVLKAKALQTKEKYFEGDSEYEPKGDFKDNSEGVFKYEQAYIELKANTSKIES